MGEADDDRAGLAGEVGKKYVVSADGGDGALYTYNSSTYVAYLDVVEREIALCNIILCELFCGYYRKYDSELGEKQTIEDMKNTALSLLMLAWALIMPMQSVAQEELPSDSIAATHEESEGEGFDMMKVIGHHISNSHTWDVFAYENSAGEEVQIRIPLPVMAYYNGDFLFTMSSSFYDGKKVEHGVNVYYMEHDKLKVEGTEDVPFDFSITRNVASMFMSCALLLLVFVGTARSYKKSEVPRGGHSLVEMAVLFVKDIADDQIGKEKSGKYTNYLLTLFFFIWFNNLIGLLPFFPGGSNLSGNISFTAILAIFTFIITNWNGTKAYWKHNLTVPGVPALMKVILIPVEIISMFTKPFTLLVRLFANITGGHILVISLFSIIFLMHTYWMGIPSVLLAFLIFTLELIFGALQAYIFTLLSALYIGLAVNQEEHHE